jgi:hypothetical protein
MQVKHRAKSLMDRLLRHGRMATVLAAVLVMGLAGNAYSQDQGGNSQGENQGGNSQGGHVSAPEITTGAAIGGCLLAGGGLLLLADRIRRRKHSN